MSAEELIKYLSWVTYLLVFAAAFSQAVRRPLRFNTDVAIFFALPAVAIILSALINSALVPNNAVNSAISAILVLAMGYMFLRLVDDFSDVPAWLIRGSEGMLIVFAVANFAFRPPRPQLLTIVELAYLVILLVYSMAGFVRESRRASGVTRRRLRAVEAGLGFLVLLFVIAGLNIWLPQSAGLWSTLSQLSGLLSGVSFYLGFAPPGLLRRAWQEPELRAFLSRAASLPRLPDTASIISEMETGAASTTGSPSAKVGQWEPESGELVFNMGDTIITFPPDLTTTTGKAFLFQKAVFATGLQRSNPLHAEEAARYGARAVLAAPITAGTKRLGVLSVYAPRAPLFADEDLALVKLLADQAAVILESRALIDEATRVRAREEATRLKEDFLSAAAHDLKTPLTTLVAQTQLLERRATRNPSEPPDLQGIQMLVKETQRLKSLVLELLDAARAEQGRLVGEKSPTNLAEVAKEACGRHSTPRHPCQLDVSGDATGMYDESRVYQLLENLLENAKKYTPEGGPIAVRVWRDGEWNHIRVADRGIGILPDDLPHIFERFHRGKNVDDRRFAGMGLGLYICRGIVEQHGGHIRVTSTPGNGTAFHIELPVDGAAGQTTGAPAESYRYA